MPITLGDWLWFAGITIITLGAYRLLQTWLR